MNPEWDELDRARAGEESAWRGLQERHGSRLLAMILLIIGHPDTANEIAQETWIRLYRSEIRHREGSVGGFLAIIAYRLALKEKARQQRQTDLEHVDIADESPSSLEKIIADERDRHVAEIVRRLDPLHRDALALRFYGGHSYQEIAELTGVPIGTVKSRMFYAVKTCQDELRKRGLIE